MQNNSQTSTHQKIHRVLTDCQLLFHSRVVSPVHIPPDGGVIRLTTLDVASFPATILAFANVFSASCHNYDPFSARYCGRNQSYPVKKLVINEKALMAKCRKVVSVQIKATRYVVNCRLLWYYTIE